MKEFIKKNNNLQQTSDYKIKVYSQLPQSGNADEVVILENDGIYQYSNNAWEKILNFISSGPSGIIGEIKASLNINDISDDWLECNGSTYDTAKYPELYSLLGTNTLPDLRESCLVGVGQNSTNSIATHDVFTLGQLKDSQTQGHSHSFTQSTHSHSIACCCNYTQHSHYIRDYQDNYTCQGGGFCTQYRFGCGLCTAYTNAVSFGITVSSCTPNATSLCTHTGASAYRSFANTFGVKFYIRAK